MLDLVAALLFSLFAEDQPPAGALQPPAGEVLTVQPGTPAQPGWNPESARFSSQNAHNPDTDSVTSPFPVFQPAAKDGPPEQE